LRLKTAGIRVARSAGVQSARGFSIIEAIVAAGLVAAALGSLTQLAVTSRRATTTASARSTAALLAVDKMEELRSGASPPASPIDALDRDANGFTDRLGSFTRRWSVQALPANAAGAVVLQVRVLAAPSIDVRLVTVRTPRAD
jgi:Tfp pilus assembly protein PilV